MDDLLADFLTETNESIAELDVALIRLERAPDDAQTLSLIFRHVHTIKGTCGFLGLSRLERVAHAAENVLGKLRDNTLTASTAVINPVLAALDRIKQIVADLAATGAEVPGDDSTLIGALATAADDQAAVETLPLPVPADPQDDPQDEPHDAAPNDTGNPSPVAANPAARAVAEPAQASQTIRVSSCR